MIDREQYQPFVAPTVLIVDSPESAQGCPELSALGTLDWLLAGKPFVRHLVEELQQVGVTNCFVLSSGGAGKISALIQEELHWSNRMRIEVLDFQVEATSAINLFSSLAEESGLLLLEARVFSQCCIREFVERARAEKEPLISAESNGVSLGMTYLATDKKLPLMSARPIDMKLNSIKLNSSASYVESNFELLEGRLPGRLPSLARVDARTRWQHSRSHVSKQSLSDNILFVDKGTHISPECHLDNVVVNKRCVIESNVSLQNVVILPDSWVPKNESISNALICGDNVYPLDAISRDHFA